MKAEAFAWYPPRRLVEQSNLTAFLREVGIDSYDALLERAESDPAWFWGKVLERLSYYRPYERISDQAAGVPFTRWCVGGQTNLVLNALDRHKGSATWDKEALIWVSEQGEELRWTYRRLASEVGCLANALRALGIGEGDVVGLYLPNVPEAVVAFLACAKLGAISLPLFSGFGVEALRDRLTTAGATAVITADGAYRRGKAVPMKSVVDDALAKEPNSVRCVVVVQRTGEGFVVQEGRDHAYDTVMRDQNDECETAQLDCDAPLMLMYTSGTTGKPKATVHSHIGLCTKMLVDLMLVMDLKAEDRVLWMSDMGWLVGPMMAVAVPMAGATWVLVEGVPDYPQVGRMWSLIERFSVSFLGLAPTTARSYMRAADAQLQGHDLSSLRICTSTGEPWTPDAWDWVFNEVCRKTVPLLNYSGGTEVGGGILGCSVLHPLKRCAFSRPIPGMAARVVDDRGNPVAPGQVGELVLEAASIGMTRGLWKDNHRYLESYWTAIPGRWRHGDWASVDADGYWYIHGRSDDTLKIAGKRTGPAEVEALLAATGHVVESAVIGLPDPVKGQAVCCVVTLRQGTSLTDALRKELADSVVRGLGTAFRPTLMLETDDLPRTRNMKVMRRVVRAIALGENPGDLSSLSNPESLDALSARFRGVSLAKAR